MKITVYEAKYRDDIIYMILDAKNALGRIPRLNEDLLDIEANYMVNGDMFWVAVDDNDRVIGTLGTQTVSESEMWLKRLYVKASMKRHGIGRELYKKAEEYAIQKGIHKVYIKFSSDYKDAARFYPAMGFTETKPYHMVKYLKIERG